MAQQNTDFNIGGDPNRFGREFSTPLEFPKSPAPPMSGAATPVSGNGGGRQRVDGNQNGFDPLGR